MRQYIGNYRAAQKLMQEKLAGEKAKIEELAYWYKSILDATPLPITVTAPDMKRTFVNTAQNGFDGFIAKPVDIRELNACLNHWVRDKQYPGVIEAARYENDHSIAKATPRPTEDKHLAKVFISDSEKAVRELSGIYEKHGDLDDEDIKLYIKTLWVLSWLAI